MKMLLIMSTMISIIFLFLKHPVSTGIMIITQTLVLAMLSGMILKSFWFAYIITITMLSGMLVLFIYMASVASNEKIKMSYWLIGISMVMMVTSVIVQMYSKTYDHEMFNIQTMMSMESLWLNNLFNSKFKYITIMMVMYLMFTMITVSYIVNISKGPLRIKK
nr:NADH dehydrogenase subunit 6 [Petillopsis calcar]